MTAARRRRRSQSTARRSAELRALGAGPRPETSDRGVPELRVRWHPRAGATRCHSHQPRGPDLTRAPRGGHIEDGVFAFVSWRRRHRLLRRSDRRLSHLRTLAEDLRALMVGRATGAEVAGGAARVTHRHGGDPSKASRASASSARGERRQLRARRRRGASVGAGVHRSTAVGKDMIIAVFKAETLDSLVQPATQARPTSADVTIAGSVRPWASRTPSFLLGSASTRAPRLPGDARRRVPALRQSDIDGDGVLDAEEPTATSCSTSIPTLPCSAPRLGHRRRSHRRLPGRRYTTPIRHRHLRFLSPAFYAATSRPPLGDFPWDVALHDFARPLAQAWPTPARR